MTAAMLASVSDPRGDWLASTFGINTIELWPLGTPWVRTIREVRSTIWSMAFTSDGRWLALDKPRTSADSDIFLVDLSSDAKTPVLITAHDAFNYFGRAYGLEVRGLQGISTATEAGTGDVQDLAAFIAERRIPAIFLESSVSPRAIEAVREAVRAKGFDVQVGGEIFSDALGDRGTPEGTYLGMLRHNVRTITAALRGEETHE